MFRLKILLSVLVSAFALFGLFAQGTSAQEPSFEFLSQTPIIPTHDVAISGGMAYIASHEYLYIYNVSNPNLPVYEGSYYAPNCSFMAVDVAQPNTIVTQNFYVCPPYNSLYILDTSNPEQPTLANDPINIAPGGGAEIFVSEGFAYIANDTGGLAIVDLNRRQEVGRFNPNPDIYHTTSRIMDVKVVGSLAYLADGGGKTWVVDVENKQLPISVGPPLNLEGSPMGIAVTPQYAYVAAGNAGIRVVDISNPQNGISEVGSTPTAEAALDVEISGNFLFVGDDRGAVSAFSLSDPRHPSYETSYLTSGNARKLALSGNLVFVADLQGGMVILRFTGLSPSAPVPFLDLPWDYEGKGLSFSEAATAIGTYFDHEFPFSDVGSILSEPVEARGSVISFQGPPRDLTLNYSNHDGYDWFGLAARVQNGDPVLAAASGIATFFKAGENNGACGSLACGNASVIDHGNGYQTRYYHLQDNDPISQSFTTPRFVNKGEVIGKVGSTGIKSSAPHIHFSVIQDKDGDGPLTFDDFRPDGLTDPFGWQSDDPDPWPNYTFPDSDPQRTGNSSYYLWINAIANLSPQLHTNGGYFELERYTLNFPSGATGQTLNLNMRISPVVRVTNTLESLGSSIRVTARDLFGSVVNSFLNFFTVSISFSGLDLSRYNLNSLIIYSSEDGVNWAREDTTINFDNQIAFASVNHLSYFALMAKRLDTVLPTTNVTLEGDEGESGWFRSDVKITLDPVDNEEGSGAYYTGYKIDNGYFHEYKDPYIISEEGNHIVEFYSVDNDENIEEVKTIEFNIDKTPPMVFLSINPSILWPPNGKMVEVTIFGDAFDNTQLKSVAFNVEDEYNEIEPIIIGFNETIELKASRKGNDIDGRTYKIIVTAIDNAGNITETYALVIVPHDQRTN